MITKKQYANQIIREFIDQRNLRIKSYEELAHYTMQSTTLGIALETLGIITPDKYPEEYAYLQTRGGIFKIVDPINDEDEVHILTIREFIDMLPDEC